MNDEWNKLAKYYTAQEWIDKPNIFAEEALSYFPKKGYILCLGDGQGQDSRFFAQKGYKVLSTDISDVALEINNKKILELNLNNISVERLDLSLNFPYKKETFDIVYAHLSLHYFSEKITARIFKDIHDVLKKGGIVAVIVNSVNDPEINTGTRIEDDFYEVEGIYKRYFSIESMKGFIKEFKVVLLDDKGKTYKDEEKGTHDLIRFVGKK